MLSCAPRRARLAQTKSYLGQESVEAENELPVTLEQLLDTVDDPLCINPATSDEAVRPKDLYSFQRRKYIRACHANTVQFRKGEGIAHSGRLA